MNKPTKILLISVFLISFLNVNAQLFEWAKQIGAEGYWNEGEARCVATDSLGNVYTIGYFVGTLDFDPGSETHNIGSSGYEDVYMQKLDQEGNLIWAHKIGGTGQDQGAYINISDSNYIYICGNFKETVDFDLGAGVHNMTSATDKDIFVAKYDLDANFLWAVKMGGTGADYATSITTDSLGNVYTTGYHYGPGDFNPGTEVYTLGGYAGAGLYISKLGPTGNFVWARGCGGTSDAISNSICLDKELSVYITGYFSGTIDFDPNEEVYDLTSFGSNDIFVQKLNVDGHLEWVKQIGGTNAEVARTIAIDNWENLVLTGHFSGTTDFDPNTGMQNLTASGLQDIFIEKMNSEGDYIWAKQMAGNSANTTGSGYGLAFDKSGNIYSTGQQEGMADFDPGAGTELFGDTYARSIFIHKLDGNGNFEWVKGMVDGNDKIGKSITLDTLGNIYSTGYFTGTVDFDTEEEVFNMTAGGGKSVYIHKLEFCETTYSNITETVCDSLISPSGLYTWTSSGTYLDTIMNQSGCDSIITFNLTVESIDTSVTINNNTLIANMESANYQWVDCNNNFAWIEGETNQSYSPTENGTYAVIISLNTCSDTSSCHDIVNIGIHQNETLSQIDVYPNPINDMIHIKANGINIGKFEIYNSQGMRIQTAIVENKNINVSKLPVGVYFLKIFSVKGDLLEVKKISKI